MKSQYIKYRENISLEWVIVLVLIMRFSLLLNIFKAMHHDMVPKATMS